MAQQHLDPTDPLAGLPTAESTAEALADYLRAQATEFLRALRLHREAGAGAANGSEESVDAARALRRSARRISGSLHTFRPLLEEAWSEELRPELAWLSGTLAREHAYQSRLDRLLTALHRLSGTVKLPAQAAGGADAVGVTAGSRTDMATGNRTAAATSSRTAATAANGADAAAGSRADLATGSRANPAASTRADTAVTGRAGTAAGSRAAGAARVGDGGTSQAVKALGEAPGSAGPATHLPATDRGNLTLGAAKAGALLDRQLTLARTRAHSTALQALGSSRFHAVADKVAVLASEVPLTPAAATADLSPMAAAAEARLTDAVAALPLITAGSPYNAEALIHGLSPDPSPHPQDAPWHQVRLLLRLHRYALEVLHGTNAPVDLRLLAAGQALNRHRDASEAAAAASSAARTPRIAPATAYALGVLHADQRHEVEAARFAFHQSWQKRVVGTP